MSIEVLSCGPLCSVQDAGRRGYARFGVSAAGPMDAGAHALANALVGNEPNAAALEFSAMGGTFRAMRPVRVAVTGGACDLRIGARALPTREAHRLAAGDVLSVGALSGGTWGYIAFSGGIETPPVLGARATHLRSGLGGLDGRRLRAGDVLPLGEDPGPDICLRARAAPAAAPQEAVRAPIRFVWGPQADRFDPNVRERMVRDTFTLSPKRDRMGMVLDGPDLPAAGGHDIVSDGIVPGAIQVPRSGRPIVLLAESQTTGGYPKIATVIGADLARLAQLPVGARLRFAAVERDRAEEIWIAHQAELREQRATLVATQALGYDVERLLSVDLTGSVSVPEAVVPGGTAAAPEADGAEDNSDTR